jgi:hypothetical protein
LFDHFKPTVLILLLLEYNRTLAALFLVVLFLAGCAGLDEIPAAELDAPEFQFPLWPPAIRP